MSFSYRCPGCSKPKRADEGDVGRRTECAECGRDHIVPPPRLSLRDEFDRAGPRVVQQAGDEERSLLACPRCGDEIAVRPSVAGPTITCPKCASTFANESSVDEALSSSRERALEALPEDDADIQLTEDERLEMERSASVAREIAAEAESRWQARKAGGRGR